MCTCALVRIHVMNCKFAGLNGKVYSFGNNGYGQLGLGDTNERYTPTLLSNDLSTVSVTAVSAGADHSLVLGEEMFSNCSCHVGRDFEEKCCFFR